MSPTKPIGSFVISVFPHDLREVEFLERGDHRIGMSKTVAACASRAKLIGAPTSTLINLAIPACD